MGSYTPERWETLTNLLGEVLDRAAGDREAYLDAVCGTDALLRDEIGRLLIAYHEANAAARFERGALDLVLAVFPERAVPTQIGAYRLVNEVGRGGMGSVWLAERADGLYEQRVAVKVMQAGVLLEEHRQRFRAERRILARLDHPNIARILDGGVSDDGQPYLVMEYVEGVPITAYCEQHALGIDDRLALFRTVCDTVAYAHQNLVVHRDLKPSNILVTADGVVKLLDFGIAKLLGADDADDGSAFDVPITQTGMTLMTPEYAAPEQVTGGAITTSTDVYALGVVLFEVLTGGRPYTFASRTPSAIEAIICRSAPTRPSTAARSQRALTAGLPPERLARLLKGDLDTIVLKALRKEPERRYPAAAQLADDLRRYAKDLPVTARPDEVGYRLGKFARRNRAAAVALVIVALSLVAGLAGTAWQARAAAAEARKAEAINTFLLGLLTAPDPREQGRDVRVATLLDQAAADLEVGFDGPPEVEAQMRQALGVTYRELGLHAEAEHQLTRALELQQRRPGRRHREVVGAQAALGQLLLMAGRTDEADSLLTIAVDNARRTLGPYDPMLGDALSTLGYVRYRQGNLEAAGELHRASVAISEAQPDPDEVEIAVGMGNVAIVMADMGRLEEALDYMERQLALYRGTYEPDNTRIARALSNIGSVLYDLDRIDQALAAHTEAVAIFQRAVSSDHPELAWVLGNLGTALFESGRLDEAEATLRESLDRYVAAHGPDNPRTAGAYLRLGRVLELRERPAEARPMIQRALEIGRAAGLPEEHRLLAEARDALARLTPDGTR